MNIWLLRGLRPGKKNSKIRSHGNNNHRHISDILYDKIIILPFIAYAGMNISDSRKRALIFPQNNSRIDVRYFVEWLRNISIVDTVVFLKINPNQFQIYTCTELSSSSAAHFRPFIITFRSQERSLITTKCAGKSKVQWAEWKKYLWNSNLEGYLYITSWNIPSLLERQEKSILLSFELTNTLNGKILSHEKFRWVDFFKLSLESTRFD